MYLINEEMKELSNERMKKEDWVLSRQTIISHGDK